MQKGILISIIIPIFNVETYLPYCLESIIEQTYTNFEAILVDDGSTDASSNICDTYFEKDRRFRVIHQRNQGLSGARNTGLSMIRSEYFCFVDGDDYIHPRFLEILHNALEQTGCQLAMIRSKSTKKPGTYSNIILKEPYILNQNEMMCSFFHYGKYRYGGHVVWNKLYKSNLKNLRFNPVISEDLDYNIRLYLCIDQIAFIDTILYYYVIRPGSITHTPTFKNEHYIDQTKQFLNYLKYIPNDKPSYQKYCILRFIKHYLNVIYRTKGTDMERYAHEHLDGMQDTIKKHLAQAPSIPFYEKVGLRMFLDCPSTYALFRWMMDKRQRVLNWL